MRSFVEASPLEAESVPVTPAPPAQATPAPWWGSPAPSVAGGGPAVLRAAEPRIEPSTASEQDDDDSVDSSGLDGWNMLEEEGSAEPAYGDEAPLVDGGREEFPLDAFIIPEHSQRLPTGYEEELAHITERIAERLEDMARQIRARGIGSLGDTQDTDELSRIMAALIAGYVSHAH